MQLYPIINNNYAAINFGIANSIKGTPPIVQSCQIDLTKQTNVALYVVGTLMAKTANYDTTGRVQMFDSTAESTNPFAGVFFDEVASSSGFVPITGNITSGFFEIAQSSQVDTLFFYSALTGFNSGTTDIDYLIANGYASKVAILEGSVPTIWVKFNSMIVGA